MTFVILSAVIFAVLVVVGYFGQIKYNRENKTSYEQQLQEFGAWLEQEHNDRFGN